MSEENTNGVDSPLMFALVRKENLLQRAKKKAADDVRAHHGTIKANGIKMQNFTPVYKQMMAQDGGDAFIQDLREQRRMMQLLKLPIGHQFSILDEFDAVDEAKKEDPEITNHYRLGGQAYLGGDEEDDCPHLANTEEGQEWLRGFRWAEERTKKGNAILEATDPNADDDDYDDGGPEVVKAEDLKKDAEKKPAKKKTTRKRSTKKAKANGVEASA